MTDSADLTKTNNDDESKIINQLDEEQSGELMEILLNTREQGQMMEQLINNQIEVKDEMINKLHKELDYYKQESLERFIDQLMKSVIKVRKDMGKLIYSEEWGDMTADDLRKEYVYIFEDLTDLLEQQNVDAYSSEPGTVFEAAIHQPIIEVTDDSSLDKKVKQSISEGYRKGEKVLLPERVVVYHYKN